MFFFLLRAGEDRRATPFGVVLMTALGDSSASGARLPSEQQIRPNK